MDNDDAGNSGSPACPPIMRDADGRKELMSTDHAHLTAMNLLQSHQGLPIMRPLGLVDHERRLSIATDYAGRMRGMVKVAIPLLEAAMAASR